MENKTEIEIDIARMLLKACLKWRIIAIISIIAALVIGGTRTATNISSVMNPETQQKAQLEYDAKLTAYEAEGRQLEQSIEEAQREIKVQQDYLEQSMLMKLDPNEEWIGSMNLYVGTDYQIMPGSSIQNENPAYKIVYAYGDYVGSGDFYNALMEKISFKITDLRYLNEMLSVSVDGGRYVLTISALADTEAHCKELLDTTKALLLSMQSQITSQIDTHTIQATDARIYSRTNPERENYQILQQNKVDDLEAAIANYRTDYIEWELEEKKLELPIVDMGHAIRNGIKIFLIVGLAMGLVMGMCFCIGYIFSTKVQGTESLPPRLHIIGEIPVGKEKKLTGIDKMFLRLFGVVAKRQEKDSRTSATAQHLSQLIRNLSADSKHSIALISDISKEELDQLTETLKKSVSEEINLVSAGNILISSESSKLAEEQAAVVLVAKQDESIKKTINSMLDQLRSYNKTILGAIVINTDAL